MEIDDFDLASWLDNYDTYKDIEDVAKEEECELTNLQDTQEKAAT